MPTKPTMLTMATVLSKPTMLTKPTKSAQPHYLTVFIKPIFLLCLLCLLCLQTVPALPILQTNLKLQLSCGTYVTLNMQKSVNQAMFEFVCCQPISEKT